MLHDLLIFCFGFCTVDSEWHWSVIFHLALALTGSVQVFLSLQGHRELAPFSEWVHGTETGPLVSGSLWSSVNAFGDCQTCRVFISSEGSFSDIFLGICPFHLFSNLLAKKQQQKVIIFSYICRVWVCDLLFQPVSFSPVQFLAQSKILFKMRLTFTLFYITSPFISLVSGFISISLCVFFFLFVPFSFL